MNIDQAVKLVRSRTGINFDEARKLVEELSTLDGTKPNAKPKSEGNGVWAIDDQLGKIWHGC
jgi:hypothetical protein